nr:hypothetical protein [Tanacetum cinerariifolium]
MEIVILEVGGIDDDILLTIKDDILREKLLNVNLLISKIKALNANPTPSFDCKTKSLSTSLNSLLEETNTFDNSLPEFKTFFFDVEEISSSSTTTSPDISLPEYEVFYDDHVKEISSGSPTTHSDSPFYASFMFDLLINPFSPADKSDFYEFTDELIPFISPPDNWRRHCSVRTNLFHPDACFCLGRKDGTILLSVLVSRNKIYRGEHMIIPGKVPIYLVSPWDGLILSHEEVDDDLGESRVVHHITLFGILVLYLINKVLLQKFVDVDICDHLYLFSVTKLSKKGKDCLFKRSRRRAAHEVPLLTVTANRVIKIEDPATATDSSGVPSTIEWSLLDFAHEDPSQQLPAPEDQKATVPEVPPLENVTTTAVASKAGQAERVAATSPPVVKERRKRGHDGVDTNAPPKVPRRYYADPQPTESNRGGKSLAAIELGMGSTRPTPASQGVPVDVSDPDPLSFAGPQSCPFADAIQSSKGAARARDPDSRIYHLPPWSDLLRAYTGLNGVAMGSQLRLRFKQETKLLKKSVAQVARRDKRIQARENEIKNLETLLEAETDMKKAVENKSAELNKELENMRALFSDLQVSNKRLSQQVSTLHEQ